jgi:hypothetical protein
MIESGRMGRSELGEKRNECRIMAGKPECTPLRTLDADVRKILKWLLKMTDGEWMKEV